MKLCKECNENERAPQRSRCYSCYGKARRGQAKPNLTTPSDLRLLFLDIETKPSKVYTWSYFKTNIGVEQVIEPAAVLCLAASWYGDQSDEAMMFFHSREDRLSMLDAAWKLLDEADAVCHFYGSAFDIPWLFTEFVQNGYPPPSPFKQIDLKNVCSKVFNFPSNKLQFVSKQLGLPGKEEHEGFLLWERCMAGDPDAWTRMESYNRQDVALLQDMFEILLPWIPNLPNRWLYDGHGGCPGCGADGPLQPAGFAFTKVSRYHQVRCDSCGGFYRDSRRVDGVTLQESVR